MNPTAEQSPSAHRRNSHLRAWRQCARQRRGDLARPCRASARAVRDDQHNEPIPDVMIVPATSDIFNWTYEILVVFEVLSPFSLRRDMVHKRNFYTRIESLTHYIVLAQDRREATVFARSNGFEPQVLKRGEREDRDRAARRLAPARRHLSRRAARLTERLYSTIEHRVELRHITADLQAAAPGRKSRRSHSLARRENRTASSAPAGSAPEISRGSAACGRDRAPGTIVSKA